MKKNAYEDSTVKKTAKILRHLKRNCNTSDPEDVKLYVSKKTCSMPSRWKNASKNQHEKPH